MILPLESDKHKSARKCKNSILVSLTHLKRWPVLIAGALFLLWRSFQLLLALAEHCPREAAQAADGHVDDGPLTRQPLALVAAVLTADERALFLSLHLRRLSLWIPGPNKKI